MSNQFLLLLLKLMSFDFRCNTHADVGHGESSGSAWYQASYSGLLLAVSPGYRAHSLVYDLLLFPLSVLVS